MDKLPPEIVLEIFNASVPKRTPGDEKISYTGPIFVPLLFSHICRSWRKLALSYGELWSHLCIDFITLRRKTKRKMMVEIFDTWLSRTKRVPLNYLFCCNLLVEDDVSVHRSAEYIITTLLSQQHRWRNVHFVWSNVELSREFPGVNVTNMPLLQSLTLSSELTAYDMRSIPAVINVAQSPQLRYLFLDGNYKLMGGNQQLEWHTGATQLNFSIRAKDHAIDTCLNFLDNVPSLTEFQANFGRIRIGRRPCRDSRVVVPDLRSLGFCDRQSSQMIKWLTLPSLRALRYCDCGNDERGRILLDFIYRSRPPLSFLELHRNVYGLDETALIKILRHLPTLRELRIYEANVSVPFFRALTEANDIDGHVICPNLTTFHFLASLYDINFHAIVDALIAMLKSRWQTMGTLKEGRLYLSPSRTIVIDPGNEASMRSLRQSISRSLLVMRGEVSLYPFQSWKLLYD
ncbi:hypothetical protein ACEPAF_1765 [Sanghuangporus sanghuang]|uniref:F-box domain-containing protein n=1 Tax=Sanghuangporus baumii TaxID=108892 RepID=A0A9Q5N7Z8_SANBA|nr:hypothetical protein A7U60_g2529 [Sanghuangporus baumii]